MKSKILDGFFIGLGFMIALSIVFFGLGYIGLKYYNKEKESHTSEFDYPFKQFDESTSGLVIKEHHSVVTDFNVEILGVIGNEGEDNWGSVSLEAELFDKDGKFLHECTEYIRNTMKPSDVENFKISCGGCEKRPIPEFDHYTIKITDAFSKN